MKPDGSLPCSQESAMLMYQNTKVNKNARVCVCVCVCEE